MDPDGRSRRPGAAGRPQEACRRRDRAAARPPFQGRLPPRPRMQARPDCRPAPARPPARRADRAEKVHHVVKIFRRVRVNLGPGIHGYAVRGGQDRGRRRAAPQGIRREGRPGTRGAVGRAPGRPAGGAGCGLASKPKPRLAATIRSAIPRPDRNGRESARGGRPNGLSDGSFELRACPKSAARGTTGRGCGTPTSRRSTTGSRCTRPCRRPTRRCGAASTTSSKRRPGNPRPTP